MSSPLADQTYRRLFTAQVIALAGTGLSSVALALLAYDLAGSNAGAVLGTAFVLKMVAYIFVAPVVGAFADQLPRRALLISLDLARAAIVLCIPFITQVWEIYVLIFLLNACSAGFTPTFQATIPDVLPDDARYTRALSLSRLAYDLENLLSPLVAAMALLVMSYHALFTINAITFLFSAALVFSVILPKLQAQQRNSGWRNITFGIRAYLATPRLRALLALYLAVAAGGAMVIVNTVVYVRDYLQGSETETALAFAAFGGGSMIIALLLPRFLDRLPDRPFMLTGGLLMVVGLGLGLIDYQWSWLLIGWVLLGAGSSLIQTPSGRVLKRSSHAGDRPALFAAQFALSHACWLLAYAIAGWGGVTLGLTATFGILGLLAAIATTTAILQWPKHDVDEIEHTHKPIHHSHPHVHDAHHQHEHEHEHQHDEATERHEHWHTHAPVTHKHIYMIDLHHSKWPTG